MHRFKRFLQFFFKYLQYFVFCIFQGLNEEDFLVRYESAIDILIELEPLGYSAAVITQVEIADFNPS